MKKLVSIMVALTMLASSACADVYKTYGSIKAVDYLDDCYAVLDVSGNVWEMTEIEDREILDIVQLAIDNCNSFDPADDIVLYCHCVGSELDSYNGCDH